MRSLRSHPVHGGGVTSLISWSPMRSTGVPTREDDEERSQRMESSGTILWDFVDWHYVTLCPFGRS